jgi:hypothetical protein
MSRPGRPGAALFYVCVAGVGGRAAAAAGYSLARIFR